MDRFEWLGCQSWLSRWQGCEAEEKEKVQWLFEGRASFHIPGRGREEEKGPLSMEAAHLFFSLKPPTLHDPAQLGLKLGFVAKDSSDVSSPRETENLLLIFDDADPYALLVDEVVSISTWRQEQGCCVCKPTRVITTKEECSHSHKVCVCHEVPSHITMSFKHLALNIYSPSHCEQSSPANVLDHWSDLCGLVERLEKMRITKPFQSSDKWCQSTPVVTKDTKFHSYTSCDISSTFEEINVILRQMLKGMDCMSDCAMRAVDCCCSDMPQMIWLLRNICQHAADQNCKGLQLHNLRQALLKHLENLQDKEQEHIATIWGNGTFHHQHDMRSSAISDLPRTKQQREEAQAILMWLELMLPINQPSHV